MRRRQQCLLICRPSNPDGVDLRLGPYTEYVGRIGFRFQWRRLIPSMAFVVLVLVFLLSISLTQFSILSPLNLFRLLHVPGFLLWGGLFILFAWIFGDRDSAA